MNAATSPAKTHAAAPARPQQTSVVDELVENTVKRRQSIVDNAAAVLGVAPDKLLDLLRNVWKTSKGQPPLTDQEMFQGISMIARYELDPIAREVYVTRTSSGLATIVGIDGWIKILDRTDHYDGFTIDINVDANGDVESVDACIYSKKRTHPSRYRAFAKEYKQLAGFMAGKIPTHMLRIFALRHAARLFTPLGGSVMTEEEAMYMQQFAPAAAGGETIGKLLDSMAEPQAQPEQEQAPAPETKPKKPKKDLLEEEPEPTLRQMLRDLDACATAEDLGRIRRRFADVTLTDEDDATWTAALEEKGATVQ